MLGFHPLDIIETTLAATTQYAKNLFRLPMRKHLKSRFPSHNVDKRQETVGTDTIFSDTPAIYNGADAAQVFVGKSTDVTDVYPMKTDKYFYKTLEAKNV
mmetsp:Transcript_8011/g.16884  ORF Transcript_8011/g.16884 Transcript_8011/m.16884 type:complete len:100 (+) Transcript_8011:1389-1688(+)